MIAAIYARSRPTRISPMPRSPSRVTGGARDGLCDRERLDRRPRAHLRRAVETRGPTRLTSVLRIELWIRGRFPSAEGLRIRSYADDAAYGPRAGYFVMSKRWTRLVLNWPAGRSGARP